MYFARCPVRQHRYGDMVPLKRCMRLLLPQENIATKYHRTRKTILFLNMLRKYIRVEKIIFADFPKRKRGSDEECS